MTIYLRSLPVVALIIFQSLQCLGQTITGKVSDALTNEAMIYVNIGVIGTTFGTITNEEGNFKLEVRGLPINSLVRFSMIGFKSQTYTISELSVKENTIRLESDTYKLPEVIINPTGKLKKVGTTGYSFRNGFCGWRDNGYAMGYEVGSEIKLGDSPVRLKSLHIRINKQSFDSSLFRLHIRSIAENLPQKELLNKNILITVAKESGWIEIDLSKYNLVFEGDIALSLEWIKVIGLNMDRLITANGNKRLYAAVTFNVKQKHGCTFTKWGSEAEWNRHENSSPSIYLKVQ
jgi:hypothetical protein